jgi:hypothetical protein
MRHDRSVKLLFIVAGANLALAVSAVAPAASIYWDGLGTTWNSTTDWSQANNNPIPHPPAVPGASDTAIFNITTVNGTQNLTLDANQAAAGLSFNSTGLVSISGPLPNTLTIGAGGITVAGAAGQDTIIANLSLAAPETWTNNSGNAFPVNGNITNGSNTLTFAGSGSFEVLGNLGGRSGGLTMMGTGTLTLGNSGPQASYTGATTVSTGTLFLNSSNAFGLSSGVSIAAGAAVDVNGWASSTNFTSVQGNGVGGNGTLINSFTGAPGVLTGTFTLSGDTFVRGPGAIELVGSAGALDDHSLGSCVCENGQRHSLPAEVVTLRQIEDRADEC